MASWNAFLKYLCSWFLERTKRIESLKNDQQKLTENSSSLKKKYKNVQEENKQVET